MTTRTAEEVANDSILLEKMARTHISHEVVYLRRWGTGDPYELFKAWGIPSAAHDILTLPTSESALLHLRCLVEFLTAELPLKKHQEKQKEMDLVALHFFPKRKWEAQPIHLLGWKYPSDNQEEQRKEEHFRVLNELHRRLAHISVQRLDDHDWRTFGPHIDAVVKAFGDFVDALPPDRSEWFDGALGPLPGPGVE